MHPFGNGQSCDSSTSLLASWDCITIILRQSRLASSVFGNTSNIRGNRTQWRATSTVDWISGSGYRLPLAAGLLQCYPPPFGKGSHIWCPLVSWGWGYDRRRDYRLTPQTKIGTTNSRNILETITIQSTDSSSAAWRLPRNSFCAAIWMKQYGCWELLLAKLLIVEDKGAWCWSSTSAYM